LTSLIATSVVRGSHQGESHGGVFLVDLEANSVNQVIDWDSVDIDWQGRGWDRGLRGIAFDGDRVFIAASNELFVYDSSFNQITSYRNPYLMHCHEIHVHQRRLYLTSTGFDSLLGFDRDSNRFSFGMQVVSVGGGFQGGPFDPESEVGPAKGNQLHLNSVFCNPRGLYLSGLKTAGLLRFDGRTLQRKATLPRGVHNARPHGPGVLFNDTVADRVRYVTPEREVSFKVPQFEASQLTHTDLDDSKIARASFGRGLCALDDNLVAAGSSPSTIAIHDLVEAKTRGIITLTHDVRNAIHGLEVWPFS
jgi:hypothetical protein